MPAKSEKQKKFFGAVMGAKKGQKGVKGAAKKVAKKMTKKEIKKYLKKESFNDVYRNLLEQTEGLADWEIGVEESPEYQEGEAREEIESALEQDDSDLLSDLFDQIHDLMYKDEFVDLIANSGTIRSAFDALKREIKEEIRDMQEMTDTHRVFPED